MTKIRFKDYLKDYLDFYHITNNEFARRIDITPKNLIDILAGKIDLSSKVIENISFVTNIPIEYISKIESNYKLEKTINDYLNDKNITITNYLNKFNYNYLKKSNYITFVDKEDKMEITKDILKYLRVISPEQIDKIETSAYYKSKNDKHELLVLWLEKCYKETLKQKTIEYKKDNIEILVNYIKECALKNEFNKEKLTKKFNEMGIFLVIEEDIPGAKIRGAFKVHRGIPAIYLTLKHKRIADIYFALLHELAHCKTDFNKAKKMSLISFDNEIDEVEEKRDKEAYNWMVNDEYYLDNYLDKTYNLEKEKKYPKSFIVYRLAQDKKINYNDDDYQKYNILI
ncbi:MAG: hypothetical protein NC483_04095 [Ruminococcus sp.]|nr:hypothetical protein [Ruminococcus sp.]